MTQGRKWRSYQCGSAVTCVSILSSPRLSRHEILPPAKGPLKKIHLLATCHKYIINSPPAVSLILHHKRNPPRQPATPSSVSTDNASGSPLLSQPRRTATANPQNSRCLGVSQDFRSCATTPKCGVACLGGQGFRVCVTTPRLPGYADQKFQGVGGGFGGQSHPPEGGGEDTPSSWDCLGVAQDLQYRLPRRNKKLNSWVLCAERQSWVPKKGVWNNRKKE
ncbi:hypothetical protein L873DRAFT_1791666 [Choiromyces venosus 120613-1]|uniref:Uncharacterized protein n=1 Tax=Choiromyces venosus 120613-1 TaxID=1336337 RepID=A0A3N4JDF3_9PEZI|nr:hypothetical protein L873DRAFT_1791666 [Choiromyces venosus 120613-1]